ncbi:MAG TPA: alpha/beta hydrolase [Steroidobacteraceae bacterium]|nr:alpha/beta hydrolase [Steroidobacteraceae bacterium]
MTQSSFTTADGCRLHYVDEGAGLPVLWQHGLGATQSQAAEVFPASSGFRRITLECRGHAGSEIGAPDALSIGQFADDALALMDHLQVERAAVGGISLGAAIALHLAVHHPQRVGALIIARPAWLGESTPERMRIYRDVAELLARYGSEDGLRRLEASERYRQVSSQSPDNAASMRGLFHRARPESTVALLSRIPMQGSGVSPEQMTRLSLPTLVIANERDYVHTIAMATEVAGLIPGAELRILPAKDVDRASYLDGFRAALEEFLSDLTEGRFSA